MRRKPMQGGGRPNHSGGGHNGGQRRSNGGGGGGYNANRPRKNYPQLREKYINQAKDALSGGDRVMAEYYFQHADHCYRMMMEEGYRPQTQQQQQEQGQQDAQDGTNSNGDQQQAQSPADDGMPEAGALPTFLTMGYTAAAAVSNVEQAAAAPDQGNWEEN
jgi:hypothetical protein